jgi:hypothetical protein
MVAKMTDQPGLRHQLVDSGDERCNVGVPVVLEQSHVRRWDAIARDLGSDESGVSLLLLGCSAEEVGLPAGRAAEFMVRVRASVN